jgi:hypothetical protein
LRLAIRISKVDPEKAQKEAEAAVQQKYGVLESSDQPFALVPPGQNPIYEIQDSYGDIRLGAPIETILKAITIPGCRCILSPPQTRPLTTRL